MATAASTFTWATHETALKAFLGLTGDSSYDAELQLYLEAAAVDCDKFCAWYYTDEDDEQVDETPTDPAAEPLVKLGIYAWARAALACHLSAADSGATMVKTGQLQESYGNRVGGLTPVVAGRRAAEPLWAPHAHHPLLLRHTI